jgi:glucan-binding YG repeat protein
MAEVVAKTGIKKEPGYLYFLNKDGNVGRVKMARRGQDVDKTQEVVAEPKVVRDKDKVYYIDGNGDVACSVMGRGRKPKQ